MRFPDIGSRYISRGLRRCISRGLRRFILRRLRRLDFIILS
ncbi:MAG TPA: hypothetical protein PLW29_04190 [Candidatus Cloacimonas acidaminovorans]|nr:hypothetical protein [Candidatus Cloacimonas acidaminovorans]HQF34749.1 hypothetical protein [Candidatus Cloacimonas acidaminovorans]HQJ17162.1 hypothetical protein [Candidatus Cloacimonas acidaminovorans]